MFRNLAVAGLVATGAFLLWPAPPGGRLVKIYGELKTADRVAVIVPGADTTVTTFDDGPERPGGAARALLAEAARLAPNERLAVVAWLGYDAPPTLSLGAIADGAAGEGAGELRRTVARLRGRTDAPVTLLCHSYGSAVCAKAMPGLPVSDLAVFGSPGVGAPSAAALTAPPRTGSVLASHGGPAQPRIGASPGVPARPRVWAGLGANDWIRFVPKTKLGPFGFGTDPMSAAFGARVFDAGSGGHSDYFAPGSASLRNLTLIVLGRSEQVTG
ncbi:alpha/beta hydrolase [Nonomuraea sp. B10E15]|uniref:alpha/beta hydrolase n=1 Tax=unclassified Nonomuraea TaxID=2593643 RepID=UPI00325D24C7